MRAVITIKRGGFSTLAEASDRRAEKARPCQRCKEPMGWGNRARKYCGPCYSARHEERMQLRRKTKEAPRHE